MGSPQQVGVLALGNWGTALAHHLGECGHDVLGWSSEKEVVEGITKNRKNPRSLTEHVLSEKLKVTGNIEEALARPFVILAYPAVALGTITPLLKGIATGTTVVSAIKGFEDGSLFTPLQKVEAVVGSRVKSATLSGPSFAKDIIAGRPVTVVSASKEESTARAVADLFTGKSLKVYLSTDPHGVEIGGAVKNVIALAAGVCDGLSLGESARAALITRGLAEMVRLGSALGVDTNTLYGLSGLGDLVMTSTSDTSRNRRTGVLLGKGEKLEKVISSIGSIVEGVHTAPLLLELGKKHGVELPITEQMSKLIKGEILPQDAVKALITRPMKREF